MRIFSFSIAMFFFNFIALAQKTLQPEDLIQIGKVSVLGLSKDQKNIVYTTKKYNLKEDKNQKSVYLLSLQSGESKMIDKATDFLSTNRISPDGKFKIAAKEVKVKKISGNDFYPELKNTDVQIYDNLNYRHWDTWEEGSFNHIFLYRMEGEKITDSIDLMSGEPFDSPQQPFGGEEDYIFSPDGKKIVYVCKKKFGKEYAISTNTDIYEYNIETQKTTNLTEGMMGYDIKPCFSSIGTLAFLSMKTDGYESDKNDLVIIQNNQKINLTEKWDGTVEEFLWSSDGKKIFFTAPTDGTVQLFEISIPQKNNKEIYAPKLVTNGVWDITSIIAQVNQKIYVTRSDMNHAAEIFEVNLLDGNMKALSHVNDAFYNSISISKTEKRYFTATDGKKLMSWIIYPPNFDPSKKYPTLLYCQGGPQSPLTQFYSTRWNFQLMASQGYIVVAPNRRGMPGHGVEWNEQISGDYGGQNMRDYLTAIDEMCKENFVDKNRLACVGASYGGYSTLFLMGNHNKRFKSFIAHDGIFDWRSMYGTTEELFFVHHDLGGAYFEKENKIAQKSVNEFNPISYVDKWDSPILIIQGGKDFRVPIEQGLQAFQAAQLKGLKSKLLYFPNENHWVLKEQNSLVWQREFFSWLKETLLISQN